MAPAHDEGGAASHDAALMIRLPLRRKHGHANTTPRQNPAAAAPRPAPAALAGHRRLARRPHAAAMTAPGARPSSPRPRTRWRFMAICAAVMISAVAYGFCAIAWAYDWHRAVTRPGIAASAVVMILGAVVLNLTAGDDE